MSRYSGKPFQVNKSAVEISDKFSDLSSARQFIDQLPDDARAQMGEIELDKDSIAVNTQQIGKLKFRVTKNSPEKIVMMAEGTPIPLNIDVDMTAIAPDQTSAVCSIDVEIPAMIRPMVAPQIQKAVDMLSNIIEKVIS